MRKKRKRHPVRMFRFLYKMGWKKAIYYPWESHRIHQTFHWPKITQKWDRLTILLTVRCLAHIPVHREHPRFQKGISPWKKVNAFFSRGASFLAKTCRSGAKTDPFRGWKAAQNPYTCAVFQPCSCSSDDRLTAKRCLSDSISRISFVKKSE